MTVSGRVRWGIMGTANIARAAFLPGLRAAGGEAAVVAGRDAGRARKFAQDNEVGRAVEGYQRLVEDPDTDALYIPVPNSLHGEWTIAVLRAGKPVLCEKPLCGRLAETQRVLAVARETGTLLWEAFVFPFHRQFEAVQSLLGQGAIGELREVQSNFHFLVRRPDNIRMSAELDGGALNDVGCYPIRLARELFGADPQTCSADATWGGDGVDVESWASAAFPGGRRLLLSCGFQRSYDTFTRLLGTRGQVHVTNPFHPGPTDSFAVYVDGQQARNYEAEAEEPSFTAAIRHINAVLRGEAPPRMLAVDTALSTAQALHDLLESAAARRPASG